MIRRRPGTIRSLAPALLLALAPAAAAQRAGEVPAEIDPELAAHTFLAVAWPVDAERSGGRAYAVNHGLLVREHQNARRAITGPGFWTADFNLAKRFRFASGFSFQLRAEVFNAFNHRNYGNPEQRIERSSFGQITGIGAARIWQLGVRFDF